MMNDNENIPTTERQRRQRELFCLEYVANGYNGADAARRAGYSATGANVQAHRLLKMPAVKKRVDELMAEQAERAQLRADEIVADLRRLAKWAMVPVPMTDRAGRKTGQDRPLDGALAVRCLELLGKALPQSLFSDRVETTNDSEICLTWSKPLSAMLEEDADDSSGPWADEVHVPRDQQVQPQLPEPEPADQQPKIEQPQPKKFCGDVIVI